MTEHPDHRPLSLWLILCIVVALVAALCMVSGLATPAHSEAPGKTDQADCLDAPPVLIITPTSTLVVTPRPTAAYTLYLVRLLNGGWDLWCSYKQATATAEALKLTPTPSVTPRP